MRKLSSGFLAVALSFSVLTACVNKKHPVSQPADTAVATSPLGTDPSSSVPSTPVAPTSSTVAEEVPQYGGMLRVAGESEVSNPWLPAQMRCDAYCFQRAYTFFETVTAVGADGEAHGLLAESVVPNADFTQWTVTVRPGVVFHDGTLLDADAMMYNLQKAGTSLLISKALKDVAQRPDGSLMIDKVDDMTFTISTGKDGDPSSPLPWPGFASTLASQWGFIASPTWLAAVDAGTAEASMPVGTGPFVVASYAPREKLLVERNANYWQKDSYGNQLPYLDAIEFRVVDDPEVAAEGLDAGGIDMMSTGSGSVIDAWRSAPDRFAVTERNEFVSTTYLLLDLDKDTALRDKRVRRALSAAIDRAELIETITAGVATAANGVFSPGQEGFLEDNGLDTTRDVDAARALIDEYIAETGRTVAVTLGTTVTTSNAQMVELIAGYWREVGVDVKVEQVPQDAFITKAIFGDPVFEAFTWASHAGRRVDEQFYWWHSFTAAPDGELSLNIGRMRDSEVDAGLEAARSLPTAQERQAAAESVNRRFAQEVYMIPLFWNVSATAAVMNLRGVGATVLPDGEPVSEYAVVWPTALWLAASEN
jgi:peptide/nickel transport system substrate-binding protein